MTLRSLALGLLVPALISVPAVLAQDGPPPPRVVPRSQPGAQPPREKPAPDAQKPVRTGDEKPSVAPTPVRQAKPLDPSDKDYEKQKEKYRLAGLDEQGYPLKDEALTKERLAGKETVVDVATDPNAKLAIEFGRDKHDFGRVRQGDQVEHTFEMAAGGSAPLIISQAKPTCGCTVSDVLVEGATGDLVPYKFGDPIEPGKRIVITGRMNTTNKKNNVQVRINVYHNDPTGTTGLALMANVEPFINATPAFLQFGDIPMGAVRSQSVDIRTTRGEPVMIEMRDQPGQVRPEGMKAELIPENPGEDGRASHWRLDVTVGEGAPEGNRGYQIRLVTDKPRPDAEEVAAKNEERADNAEEGAVDEHGNKKPTHQIDTDYTINVGINYKILGQLSVSPSFVPLGLVRPGLVVPRTVKLVSHDPNLVLTPEMVTIELTGQQGKPLEYAEFFSTSVTKSQGANGLDIELRLANLPEGTDGAILGEMIINTGVPTKPREVVKFSGVCRAGSKPGGER